MKRIVDMRMQGGTLCIRTRIHMEVRTKDAALAQRLLVDGIARIGTQGPYMVDGRAVEVVSEADFAEEFSLFAVNVRVEDVPLRREHGIRRLFNTVSRAYWGARFAGLSKAMRRLLRFPDVFINLGGRDIGQEAQYAYMCSVVAHEFAHVWGCADQYKYRSDAKRRPDVAADDLMYRTGASQRMQPYHIKRLCACAGKGRLPLRRIV